jgi:protein-S-isoprenylcysteine O-methyltransferase Ste14
LDGQNRDHGITHLNLASAGAQLVAWVAFLRCAGVAAAVARQALRRRRTVVTQWGLVETLAAPEPLLMGGFTYVLFMHGASHATHAWVTYVPAILGALLSVVGAMLWLWAFATIPGLSSGHYVLPEQRLITRGPYATVRHPIYLAVILLWCSVAAAYVSISMLAVALLYVVPAYALYARSEEKMMVEHFGAAYREYQQQTGMLFPRLRAGRPTSR